MDRTLRNALRGVVAQCRRLLEADLRQQLEGVYGFRPDGTIEDETGLTSLDARQRAVRRKMVEAVRHEEAQTPAPGGRAQAAAAARAQAVARFARACAFTVLNRLAALKLMEAPGQRLVQESVGQGPGSSGFRQFQRVSPALRGDVDAAYRLYLELLCDDLAAELGALFDGDQPQALLFPSAGTLKQVLEQLNRPEIGAVWGELETLGWMYQYYTPREQREQARRESQAPRNSYELSFRNQFYTPRYVVEFLVENTLGRQWYEQRQGQTRLKEACRFLVRYPNEVFLAEGAPADDRQAASGAQEDVSKEEALRRPQFVGYRAAKDPRTIRVLDPACGSGHFLLYCYELLVTIYDEAYEDERAGEALRREYPDREAYRRAVPELILRHNLYGIDIDLRAAQLAQLALWLRAQRAYGDLKVRVAERPRIQRVNVVCAEPMPGEADLLEEFLNDLEPPVLRGLAKSVWSRMQLAAEAGSLLKVDEELREAIGAAKQAWRAQPRHRQAALPGLEAPRPVQGELELDFTGISDDGFWEEAERRVLEALAAYAAQAGAVSGHGYRRRLFAEDAAQGFAFVDVCRQRYDVVLMNPPFGEASLPSKAYVERAYPRTKNDVYAAFVERGLGWLEPGGLLGAITSRTGFFLSSFQKWREEILLKEARPTVFADLGYGVLDTAMVETAAYCLERTGS